MDDNLFSKPLDKTQNLIEILKKLCTLPSETEWLEFKHNNSKPELIGEYISAIANSACLHNKKSGFLIFGVQDKTHVPIGTTFRPYQAKIGNEEIENWLSRLLEPHIDFKIKEFKFNNHIIVMFIIDPAHNRPITFKGISYIRIGSYKKKLLGFPEKERKIWNKGEDIFFEKGIALAKIDKDRVLQLLDYNKYFDLLEIVIPTNINGIINKFIEEQFIQKVDQYYNITNLGAILFAKNLDDFEKLSRKSLRIVIYKGSNKLEAIKEKVISKGYTTSISSAIEYINDQLPQNEEIGRVFRKKINMFPEIAIRELVINALIHQDFSVKGAGPIVEIFTDRIEFTNPGVPLVNTLRFIDCSPESRNEYLAKIMRRMNICEERGSGIDKTIAAIETYQLPAPEFIAGDNYLKAILYAHKQFKDMEKNDKVRACYQHCCLCYVMRKLMDNKSLRERFEISERNYPMISRLIGDTIEAKLIKSHDIQQTSKKFAKYIPFWA